MIQYSRRAKFSHVRSDAEDRLFGQPNSKKRAIAEAIEATEPDRLTADFATDIETVRGLRPGENLAELSPKASPKAIADGVQGLEHISFETETAAAYHAHKHGGELPPTLKSSGDPVTDYMAAAQDTIQTGRVTKAELTETGATRVVIRRDYNQPDGGKTGMEAIVYVSSDGRVTLATYGAER